MKKLPSVFLLFAALLCLAEFNPDPVKLLGCTNKSPLSYEPGEEMIYTVKADLAGQKAEGVFIAWIRRGDDGKVMTGRVPADQPAIVKTSLDRPGFVSVDFSLVDAAGKHILRSFKAVRSPNPHMHKILFLAGTAVHAEKLTDCGEPKDFDAFWARQKARLAKVPFEGREELQKVRTVNGVDIFIVSIPCAGPRPVTGFLTVPVNAKPKSLPAYITFDGYGTHIVQPPASASGGIITLNINAHGQKLLQNGEYYRKFFASIRTKRYSYAFDPEENKNPETAYFNGMALRVLRAIEYLKSRPEWNGIDLVAIGGSQGGLQAMWAAALDQDVSEAKPFITWCCDLAGQSKKGRLHGPWRIPYVPALDYYDPVFMAKRITRATVVIPRAGLGDYTCPPSGLAICYNNIASPRKSIRWVQGRDHAYVPENAETIEWKNTACRGDLRKRNSASSFQLMWDFSKNGNGAEWKSSPKLESVQQPDGLYLHGPASAGVEIELTKPLDADIFKIFHYGISAAEYGGGWLYFARSGEEFSKERRIRIPTRGFHALFENSVDCSKNRFWRGLIKKLRYAPLTRELDNVSLKYLFFADDTGLVVCNGSFETPAIKDKKHPYNWKVAKGTAELVNQAYAGEKALHLHKDSVVEGAFELEWEREFELTFAKRLSRGGNVTLVFRDIFDKKISERTFVLEKSSDWAAFKEEIVPPAGAAYVNMRFAGEGNFDAVCVKSIVPAAESYRWWNASNWIWAKDSPGSVGKPVYFRKAFKVDNARSVKSMKVQIATRNIGAPPPCDALTVYVNGKKIAPATETYKWNWVHIFELAPYLKDGRNLIAFEVVNNMSPGAVNVDILQENSGGPNRFMRFGSDESWLSSTAFAQNWYSPDFASDTFKSSLIRGQATPGSFARLPYRFLGNAGEMEVRKLDFPKRISTSKKYQVKLDLALRADPEAKKITGDAALFCHLIDAEKNVTVKFKVLPITEQMLKNGKAEVTFDFNPEFLRKGDYTLRIFADRLELTKVPVGFQRNSVVNFMECPVTVVDQQKRELANCKIMDYETVPKIVVNGKKYHAFRFSNGSHTQGVTEKSLDISDKARNRESCLTDVHISNMWQFREDGTCDFSGYDTYIMSYLSRHPNSYFTIHWPIDTAGSRGPMRHWILQHMPEAAMDSKGSTLSGTYQSTNTVPSMASVPWQNAVAKVTEEFVRHIAASPYADRVIGLMPCCGISYEWIYWGAQAQAFMDYSLPFQNGFRDFLRNKYKTLAALNQAWNKQYTTWAQVAVPTEQERRNRQYRDFLLKKENQAVSDLRSYLNTTVSDAMLKMMKAVKDASGGKMLAGAYYGYNLYFCGPYFAPFSGHFALGRGLESKYLDFLVSPCRYDDRGSSGAGGSMLPLASLRKHKKLYVHEADLRLLHSWSPDGKILDLRGSKSVMERDFAFALANGAGLEWLDFGEGWVPEDRRLVSVFENCQRVARELAQENEISSEDTEAIAVVTDEKAISRVAYDQRLFLNLVGLYPNLLRSGTAVHWYLLDDLEKLESYKMILFASTVTQFTPEQEHFIQTRLMNRNRTLVYLYSTGIYRNGEFSVDNIGRLLNRKMKYQAGFSKRVLRKNDVSDPVVKELPAYYSFGFAEPTEFFIYPETKQGDKILFRLANSNLPGMVKMEYPDCKVIYSSSPGLSSLVIQNIAQDAGCRIFNPCKGDITYGAKGFYAVYSLNGGKRIFNVSPDVKRAKEMLSNEVIEVRNGRFEFDMKKHATVMFRLYK